MSPKSKKSKTKDEFQGKMNIKTQWSGNTRPSDNEQLVSDAAVLQGGFVRLLHLHLRVLLPLYLLNLNLHVDCSSVH